MRVVRGLANLHAVTPGCVVTIGNFDGVHLGHQAILDRLRAAGRDAGLPVAVMTFEPQPREYFRPDHAVPRLTRLREKVAALAMHGVDRLYCLRFDQRMAALPARRFVAELLVDGLGARCVVVGDDFRFGRGREGDFAMLEELGERYGFSVEATPSRLVDGERVSSTRVRELLARGDMSGAARLLGRPYAMTGRVAHGDRRGRTIGFPTANVFLHRRSTPVQGVFAVRMSGLGGEPVPGVANVGTRPTVGGERSLLEVHLFDFDRDIYGRYVQVEFLHRIRDERRFDSFEALRARIELDVVEARAWFAAPEPDGRQPGRNPP